MNYKKPKGGEPLPVPVEPLPLPVEPLPAPVEPLPAPVEPPSESEYESFEAEEEEKQEEQNILDRFIEILRKILINENISVDDITFIEKLNGEPNFIHLSDEQNLDASFIFQVYIRHKIINAASEKERRQIIDKFAHQLYNDIGELSESSKDSLDILNYISLLSDILTTYNNLGNGSSESKSSSHEPPTKKPKYDGMRKSKRRSTRKSKRRSKKSKKRSVKKSKKRSKRKSKRHMK